MTTNTETTDTLSPADAEALAKFETAFDAASGLGYNEHSATYLAAKAAGLVVNMGKGRPPIFDGIDFDSLVAELVSA